MRKHFTIFLLFISSQVFAVAQENVVRLLGKGIKPKFSEIKISDDHFVTQSYFDYNGNSSKLDAAESYSRNEAEVSLGLSFWSGWSHFIGIRGRVN